MTILTQQQNPIKTKPSIVRQRNFLKADHQLPLSSDTGEILSCGDLSHWH